jgi:HlyD family secretion protein
MRSMLQTQQRRHEPIEKEDQVSSGANVGLPLIVVERENPDLPDPQHKRAGIGRWAFAIGALVAMSAAIYWYSPLVTEKLRGTSPPVAASSIPAEEPVIFGLGTLVPEGEVISVALPFGAGDARIASLDVKEGDHVEENQIIAVLDSAPTLQAAIESAEANLAVQRAILEQTKLASISSRQEAQASLDSAKATLENARLDFERTASLLKKGAVAKTSFDAKQAALMVAQRAVDKSSATLSRFDQSQSSGRQDIVVAEMRVLASQADLAKATRDLAKAYVRAPISGTILSLENQVGEKPGATGFATMANLDRMTAEVEVYQTSVGGLRVGSAVTLTADALKKPLTGKISRIGLDVKKQTVIDSNPAANTDARVVKVYVALDPTSSNLARPFTNLQMTARIKAAALQQ